MSALQDRDPMFGDLRKALAAERARADANGRLNSQMESALAKQVNAVGMEKAKTQLVQDELNEAKDVVNHHKFHLANTQDLLTRAQRTAQDETERANRLELRNSELAEMVTLQMEETAMERGKTQSLQMEVEKTRKNVAQREEELQSVRRQLAAREQDVSALERKMAGLEQPNENIGILRTKLGHALQQAEIDRQMRIAAERRIRELEAQLASSANMETIQKSLQQIATKIQTKDIQEATENSSIGVHTQTPDDDDWAVL